jgi:RNA polymerase sigma-54 factor
MQIKERQTHRPKLSSVLRNWLPVLQANLNELEDVVKEYREENPFIEIHSGFEQDLESLKKEFFRDRRVSSENHSDKLENLAFSYSSLYKSLLNQIEPPLFPTPISQKIAEKIVENIDESGFFEGDVDEIAYEFGKSGDEVERVRQRFSQLEPTGVGAIDTKESLLFQLRERDEIGENLYNLIREMIDDLENLHTFEEREQFKEALKVIRSFRNPPALEFFEDSPQIVPDLFIVDDGGFKIYGNSSYYPKIEVNREFEYLKDEYVLKKLHEAKLLIDSLHMRKATIYKIGLMILEYQYEFFTGGDIQPLTLQVLADEFGHNISTISRAISNKYIQCDRGIYPMKFFFSTEVDEGVSSDSIRETILQIVESEDREKPLSDQKILELVKEKFRESKNLDELKLVRRTITKYRKQLEIESSSKRKRIYLLQKS